MAKKLSGAMLGLFLLPFYLFFALVFGGVLLDQLVASWHSGGLKFALLSIPLAFALAFVGPRRRRR